MTKTLSLRRIKLIITIHLGVVWTRPWVSPLGSASGVLASEPSSGFRHRVPPLRRGVLVTTPLSLRGMKLIIAIHLGVFWTCPRVPFLGPASGSPLRSSSCLASLPRVVASTSLVPLILIRFNAITNISPFILSFCITMLHLRLILFSGLSFKFSFTFRNQWSSFSWIFKKSRRILHILKLL